MTDRPPTTGVGPDPEGPGGAPATRTDSGRRRRASRAATVAAAAAHRDAWTGGMSRRAFLAGRDRWRRRPGRPLVTARASSRQPGATGTLVVVFPRGGLDGLSVVVPAADPHLPAAGPASPYPPMPCCRRPGLRAPSRARTLHPCGAAGSSPPSTGSRPPTCPEPLPGPGLERGGSSTGTSEGWLDRALDAMGPGTTFWSLSVGPTSARAWRAISRA